ncbi:ABC transporter ATP-binding protein [Rhodococcus qingshengii]|uniref:ABC transporter ATP-binding protein n=1 Tax=Rhodococcus qingshengii TaxID=334542 RepID=UPI0036D8A7A7
MGGVLCMIGAVASLGQPIMAKVIVDALGRDESVAGALVMLTSLTVCGAVIAAFGYYVLGRVAEDVVVTTRLRMISTVLRMRLGQTNIMPPGDLLSRITTDTTLLRQAVSQTLVEAIKGVVMLVVIVVAMAMLDWTLLVATLGVLAVAALAIGAIVPYFQRWSAQMQNAVGDVTAMLERLLGGFRTVKAFGEEPEEFRRLEEGTRRAWTFGVRLAGLGGLVSAGALLAIQVSFLVVLGIGGARVGSGIIPVGTLIAFLLYLFALIEPVAGLVTAASTLSTGLAAARRIQVVEGFETEDIPLRPCATDRPMSRGGACVLRFDDVWFRYPSTDRPVHSGVSFDVPARGLTAIVGPSGAGKSTVFSLVERFYEPERGRVELDGTDVRDWPLDSLRAQIGYVEQDASVLAGSLRENLVIGTGGADDGRLWAVLHQTRLAAFVESLPDGLDTQIGHRGASLSGGERQRVAIARALLRSPRLLLLDEATSQLDAVNEAALREIVVDVAREVTVVAVAHRLSTVSSADQILVMERGMVRATGTHEELVDGDELYRELAATQLLVARS